MIFMLFEIFFFDRGNFIDAALMSATAFKFGIEKNIYDFQHQPVADDLLPEREHICIIV